MFEREHHQLIEQVLCLLDAELLRQHQCYFGGGTAIALRFGEYRESVDMDFMVSDIPSYRALRALVREQSGVMVLFKKETTLVSQVQEVRADQYGIRTRIGLGPHVIKFEIVLEGRIRFECPGTQDELCGVSTLSALDLAASKLLANSDWWADEGVFNRDVIDLAMMRPSADLLRLACVKAEAAYGAALATDLHKALDKLIQKPDWLERCMRAMNMQQLAPARLVASLIAIRNSVAGGIH